MDELEKISEMSKAKHMLYLVDACYGGIAAIGSRGSRGLDVTSTPNYIEKITRNRAVQIITAGGKDEEVQEKAKWGASAFTFNLKRGLKDGNADWNADGYITANELGLFLQQKVTIDSDYQQTPQYARMTTQEGEFVFVYSENTIINQQADSSADEKMNLILEKLDKVEKQTADKTTINEKVEDAEDEQSINKYKYQITASTTMESLALNKKSERQLRSGGILAGSGFLFFIDTGSSISNNILKVAGVIGGGIGILYYLAIKSKAEKKYDIIKDIDNKDEKERLAYNHLVFLADEAKRNRQYKMVTFGAISAYSLLGGTINQYRQVGFENKNLYNGLFNGTLALYHYKVLSKEEKALENYSNQP
jgi:hypothetical protein